MDLVETSADILETRNMIIYNLVSNRYSPILSWVIELFCDRSRRYSIVCGMGTLGNGKQNQRNPEFHNLVNRPISIFYEIQANFHVETILYIL